MDSRSIIAAMVLILALTGCDPSDTIPLTEPKYTAQTPAVLRNIPISDLFFRDYYR